MKSERVKSLGGPGGLRCNCCGGSKGRKRASAKRNVRALIKRHRRKMRKIALEE